MSRAAATGHFGPCSRRRPAASLLRPPPSPAPRAPPRRRIGRRPGARTPSLLRELRIVSRIASKPGTHPAPQSDARGDIVSHTLRRVTDSPLDHAIADARDALLAKQDTQGYWLFELEA